MMVETSSWRMRVAAAVSRLFPLFLSGRVAARLYSSKIAQRENAGFTARSSLADVILRLDCADRHGTPFAVRGFFDWHNVLLTKTICRRGDTLIDIGANVGTETLLFGKIVGPEGCVIAFEPEPRVFAALRDNVEINKMRQIKLYDKAVSNAKETAWFTFPPSEWESGSGQLGVADGEQGQGVEVNCVPLDEMYRNGEFGAPRLIVMDIEGSEMLALQGARRLIAECRPFFIFEVNPALLRKRGLSPGAFVEFFESLDYGVWKIERTTLGPAPGNMARLCNWLAIPDSGSAESAEMVTLINRRMKLAAFLPLIRGLNPLVIKSR